jgi:ubiquinone/menaquinone biosynthesis C-methylase UbiE
LAISSLTNILSAWRSRLVAPLEGDVLEIGAGTGPNFPHYRQASAVHAIEPDPGRASQAEQAATKATGQHGIPVFVKVAPAEQLPYTENNFDVVVSSLVFCSVSNPHQALGEIERVLKPGGVLWMVEHVRPASSMAASLAAVVTPWWRQIAHNCHLDRPTLSLLQERGWQVAVLRRRGIFVKLRATRPS